MEDFKIILEESMETSFHDIPAERKSQIFDSLSFEDKIRVSRVCRDFAIVAQNSPSFKFTTTINNENLKFVAERSCPLDLLKVENWTSILRDDLTVQNLLIPVYELRLKCGISRHNLDKLFGSTGGTVEILSFQRSFFNLRLESHFPENPHPLKWESLQALIFKVPGGQDSLDAEHLKFLRKLFSHATLPTLTTLSVELGRKLGADASRVNRNGKFYSGTIVPLLVQLLRFIAAHKSGLKNLKLYFLMSVQQDGIGCSSVDETIPPDVEESLTQLNLNKVQVRHYDDQFKIRCVRHLVEGATKLTHIEYEQCDSLYPEVYSAIERNSSFLKTVILEVRMNERSEPAGDIYRYLHVLKNCMSLETLHLRGLGLELVDLTGVPSTVSTLRIGLLLERLYQHGQGFGSFIEWMLRNLPELSVLEVSDPGNVAYTRMSGLLAGAFLGRLKKFKHCKYMETNWFGDYSRSIIQCHELSGVGIIPLD